MPEVTTRGGSVTARLTPSAVVWANGRAAAVIRITSDGRMSSCEISRGWLRERPFLAQVVRAIGDQQRLLILGPRSVCVALEREYASIVPRRDRLVDVEPSGPIDLGRLGDRLRRFAA